VGIDFKLAGHLPNLRRDGHGKADPHELPRQRRGITPQMHGRYPDYDVLEQARHWDEVTRRAVLRRVEQVPPLRFFTAREAATLNDLCDVLTAQDAEPRIPVINYIDEKYHEGRLDGFQFHDMPDDREAWRMVAAGLDEEARERGGGETYAAAAAELKRAIVGDFAEAKLHGGVWGQLNVERAFGLVMRGVLDAYYSHPYSWNEIGFGGPAYPRGYSRFGSPHLQAAERETWEGQEAFDKDPVRDRPERPPS
jgi:hypothetical protein